jgi:hypothetical protein
MHGSSYGVQGFGKAKTKSLSKDRLMPEKTTDKLEDDVDTDVEPFTPKVLEGEILRGSIGATSGEASDVVMGLLNKETGAKMRLTG